MKKGLIVIVALLLTSCGLGRLETPVENQCKQDYDCGKCVGHVLFGMRCDRGYCDPSTQFTQFDCTQEIKREFGQSYTGTCTEDSQGAHCIVAPSEGGRFCTSDAECSRCNGKTQYTSSCNPDSHQCDTEEDSADCNAVIEAQFGKSGTCKIVDKAALCVVEGT